MVAGLFRNKQDPTPEPFPPGSRIYLPDTPDRTAQASTIEAIVRPAPNSEDDDKYILHLDSGPAIKLDFPTLYSLVNPEIPSDSDITTATKSSVPYWISDGQKVTMDHNGEFHKGFVVLQDNGTYRFSVRRFCCGCNVGVGRCF